LALITYSVESSNGKRSQTGNVPLQDEGSEPLKNSIAATAKPQTPYLRRINRILMFAGVLMVLAVCAFIVPFMRSFASLAAVAGVTGLFQVSEIE